MYMQYTADIVFLYSLDSCPYRLYTYNTRFIFRFPSAGMLLVLYEADIVYKMAVFQKADEAIGDGENEGDNETGVD